MAFNRLISFIILLAFISCEESMVVIPEIEIPITDRTVLIEELTGVKCPNCPKGASAVETILNTFEGKVYAIAIHGTLQADPLSDSKYDFRNEYARDLEEYHKPFWGKPSALFNRYKFEGEDNRAVDNIGVWSSYVEQELLRENEVTLLLDHTYDAATRRITVDATVIPLKSVTDNFRISVFVTESGIIDLQENQNTIIEDYEHNHVLRHMMTNYEGDPLADVFVEGEFIKRQFSYVLPEAFDDQHIEVVVSIHKTGSGDRRILQNAGFHL